MYTSKINPCRLIMTMLLLFFLIGCTFKPETKNGLMSSPDNNSQLVQNGEKQITIGFAMWTQAEERWVNERMYFEQEAAKYGAKVITVDAQKDEALQNKQVEELVKKDVDVLVIVPVNAKTSAKCVALAKKASIPVMAYSRMIDEADLDAYIGFDVLSIGEYLAEAAIEKVPNGNYMIINGASIDNNAYLENKGYKRVLQPFIDSGDIQVVYQYWCDNWAPEKAYESTEEGLKQNNYDVDAILVSNDGMASGVIQSLKLHKLEGKVFVTGTDGELSALQRIAEGTQAVTLLFPQKEFAEEAARAAISLANKLVPADATGKTNNRFKDVPTIFAKTVLITKENLNEVIIKSGLQKKEDVYQNIPKEQWPQ